MRLLDRRRAGVLLHVASLPGPGATGRLGANARRFVDFLADGGFTIWQTLPLGPPDAYGSPYCLSSAFAGDARLIDADELGALPELPAALDASALATAPVDLYRSFAAGASARQRGQLAAFMRRERHWLLPYGLFRVCRSRFGDPWWYWPEPLRRRERAGLRALLGNAREEFRGFVLEQYVFDLQWSRLRRYANERGVYLFGDLPFYMDRDSVEVWWDRALFALDADDAPLAIAGVPPDYFNADGQLWGNPLYDWDAIERDGFRWWIERLRGQLARFDLLRIDHFRALESYWEVPAASATARDGRWRPGPGDRLLSALGTALGEPPLVAEDLGIITDEVRALRDRFGLPGMLVLQFAFDGKPDNPHLPANHRDNAVVYTGTHDNDTTVGWYAGLDEGTRRSVEHALGVAPGMAVPDALIDACYASRAKLAVVPLQDLLGVGSESRMNTPGTTEGNWRWRCSWEQIGPEIAVAARERARRTSRL